MTKQQILNLFLDNSVGNILPEHMRTFVEAIFTAKQDTIPIVTDTTTYQFQNHHESEIIFINSTDKSINGVYISTKDSPLLADFICISGPKSLDYLLQQGDEGDILSIKNGKFSWSKPLQINIKGSASALVIATKRPEDGDIWISTDELNNINLFPFVVHPGDGLMYESCGWVNIGQIRGAQGEQGIQGIQGAPGSGGIAELGGRAWNSTSTYFAGDIVSYLGKLYSARTTSPTVGAAPNNVTWLEFTAGSGGVEKGGINFKANVYYEFGDLTYHSDNVLKVCTQNHTSTGIPNAAFWSTDILPDPGTF